MRTITLDPTLVLLSMTDPGWAQGRLTVHGKTWTYVPWGTLARHLDAEFSGQPGFDSQIMAHEASVIERLSRPSRRCP